MTNPARLLHTQLLAWYHGQDTAQNKRTCIEPSSWDRHRLAVVHLNAIDELLKIQEAKLNRKPASRKHFNSWVQAVFAYPGGWTTGQTARISQTAMDSLDQCADSFEGLVHEANAGSFESLSRTIRLIRETLAGSDAPADMKRHVSAVVMHLEWCLAEFEIVGDFELSRAIDRLIGAVSLISVYDSEDGKRKWNAVFKDFVFPFSVNLVSAAPVAAITHIVAGAIGQ